MVDLEICKHSMVLTRTNFAYRACTWKRHVAAGGSALLDPPPYPLCPHPSHLTNCIASRLRSRTIEQLQVGRDDSSSELRTRSSEIPCCSYVTGCDYAFLPSFSAHRRHANKQWMHEYENFHENSRERLHNIDVLSFYLIFMCFPCVLNFHFGCSRYCIIILIDIFRWESSIKFFWKRSNYDFFLIFGKRKSKENQR